MILTATADRDRDLHRARRAVAFEQAQLGRMKKLPDPRQWLNDADSDEEVVVSVEQQRRALAAFAGKAT